MSASRGNSHPPKPVFARRPALQPGRPPTDTSRVESGNHKRLLGEVLVGEGILTESQLADALELQRATGQPLGVVLVSSGVLSGPTLAMALADQSGGPLQTEHGWGTGRGGPHGHRWARGAARGA